MGTRSKLCCLSFWKWISSTKRYSLPSHITHKHCVTLKVLHTVIVSIKDSVTTTVSVHVTGSSAYGREWVCIETNVIEAIIIHNSGERLRIPFSFLNSLNWGKYEDLLITCPSLFFCFFTCVHLLTFHRLLVKNGQGLLCVFALQLTSRRLMAQREMWKVMSTLWAWQIMTS